jgi:hypothetical protein
MRILLAAGVLLVAGCGLPVRDQKVDGPYRIWAADGPEDRHLSYWLGDGNGIGRVEATIVGVGHDDRYITVVRRPRDEPSVTEYFYVIRELDGPSVPPEALKGPFDRATYETEAARLNLPGTEPVS